MLRLEIIDLSPISYELNIANGFHEQPGNGSLYSWKNISAEIIPIILQAEGV